MLRRFLTLGTGEVAARALYVFAFVVLARSLGKEALGQFGFALTVTSYLVLAVQQGLDQIALRDVCADRSRLTAYVRAMFGLRLAAASALFSLLLLYSLLHGGTLLVILGLTCFSTALAPRWVFQAFAPRQAAVAAILSQTIFAAGALLVRNAQGVYLAAAFQVAADFAAMAYLLRALIPLSGKITPAFDPRFWMHLLRESWPVSVSSLLGVVIYNFDLLALGWFRTPAELGLYLACYRCATVFSPLLSMLQLSVLPGFVAAFPESERLWTAIRSAAIPAVLAAFAVAAVFSTFPAAVLRLVYGAAYVDGAVILQILAWSLPVQAIRSILRQALLACHLQRADTRNMAASATTSAGIDLLFVPRLGPSACAVSTLCSEVVLAAASAITLRRKVFGSWSR